ncbi:MAG: polysaccharide deacetylase family protein [Chitinophagaceae bacterium]
MKYFIKTPWWLKKIFASYTWSVPVKKDVLFLTFDDGPHPEITGFVLDELKKHNAKATFFCIGKNVLAYPEMYKRILDEGHAVGNHTQHHLNGWQTDNRKYLADVFEATRYIDSPMFRPPYGRITTFQARNLRDAMKNEQAKVIMWDVLSADFDETLSGEDCLKNVVLNAGKGSVIVFHDSEKAFTRLKYSLPKVLDFFEAKGYKFEKLTVGSDKLTL